MIINDFLIIFSDRANRPDHPSIPRVPMHPLARMYFFNLDKRIHEKP
jgi:hypothetical protein